MAVSCPGNCFISYTQKYFSNIPELCEEIGTWSYRHNVLYVKLRHAKDSLKYNRRKPALLRPCLHINTTPIMLKIAKIVPSRNMPLGQCRGCIYSIGPQHQHLPRYTPDCPCHSLPKIHFRIATQEETPARTMLYEF